MASDNTTSTDVPAKMTNPHIKKLNVGNATGWFPSFVRVKIVVITAPNKSAVIMVGIIFLCLVELLLSSFFYLFCNLVNNTDMIATADVTNTTIDDSIKALLIVGATSSAMLGMSVWV